MIVRAGWKYLAAGVYDDKQGGLHLDIAEMLAAAGKSPTPAAVDEVLRGWEELARQDRLAIYLADLDPTEPHESAGVAGRRTP